MAIADRINEMYTHVGDVYDTITNVDLPTNKNIQNIPQTIKDSYLEIMNNGIDTIWNNWEKVTGSGTSISLSPTLKAPMKNSLKGNTYQTQYSGKNLLPPTIATETKNGITLTNNGDGSYTLTGTYSSSTEFSIDLPTTLNGTYSFSGNNPVASSNIQFRILKSSGSPWSTYLNKINSTSENQSITNGTKQGIRIVGSFTSGFTLKPQLESGSTATSYEPYVGGVATPNPTTPIPVNVVSGDNEIIVNNANFLKLNDIAETTKNGVTYSCTNGILKLSGTATNGILIDFEPIYLPAGTYYLSRNSSGTSTGSWQNYLRNSSGNLVQGYNSFTINEGQNVFFRLYMNSGASWGTEYIFKPMVSIGTTAPTTYEPYQGNTYNIDLPVENLYKVEDITTTTKNGVTYSVENGVITLNGTVSSGFDIDLSTYYPLEAGTYTISCQVISGSYTGTIGKYVRKPSGSGYVLLIDGGSLTATRTITVSESNENAYSALYLIGGAVCNNLKVSIQLEKGSKVNSYTPFGTTPIELCKIGNYQDYFYKDSDKWYLHKEIGKNIYTGASGEVWTYYQGIVFIDDTNIRDLGEVTNVSLLSNLFQAGAGKMYIGHSTHQRLHINLNNFGLTDITNVTQWKTWLSTHNLIVYFIQNLTNTEITNTTLINQLEQFYQAQSKNNQTNITQINNDLPFIISASALKKGDTIENNSASLLMSFGGLPNTNGEEETPDFEEDVSDVEEETPIEESIEEEIDEEPVEEETDEEPVEEETEIEEEGE